MQSCREIATCRDEQHRYIGMFAPCVDSYSDPIDLGQITKVRGITLGGAWYRNIGGGMGAALNAAAAMDACTLFGSKHLAQLRRQARPAHRRGGRDLVNCYDLITLNPDEHAPEGRQPAQRFANWLASSAGQTAMASYQVVGQKLFHPEYSPP